MTLTVRSETSNKHYFVELDETNQATACGCLDRQYRPGRAGGCKHMREVTTQVARAIAFAALRQQYDYRGMTQREIRRAAYLNFELSIGVL